MDYYLVSWPCDTAPFEAAFLAAAAGNVLSANVSADGTRAVIKAPSGIEHPAVLAVHVEAPFTLCSSPDWTGQEIP